MYNFTTQVDKYLENTARNISLHGQGATKMH